eukprot:TRINITY_DN3103_c0_g1_i1.p1 TRINITY_DN3103_c0_g1~~TRINITY_DN3103_c0_g1_i1.p1  ORF type:complete len:410 (-),score=53.23 TRINITY_DN3103_c0_g1_i1:72-1268(-)
MFVRTLLLAAVAAAELDVRVSRALGSRDGLRISVIDGNPQTNYGGFFDYNAQFKYKWTNFSLHSVLKQNVPKGQNTFSIANETITINVPANNAPVRGVVFGDPCVYATDFSLLCEGDVGQHLPVLLNHIQAKSKVDWWSILGDNFYDRTGHNSAKFFSQLSAAVKATPLLTVPGNHDYWIAGSPGLQTDADQFGVGFMQYYGQDTISGKNDTINFLDFSVKPSVNHIAHPSNFFFYNMIGNIGFIGYGAAYEWDQLSPYFTEACTYFQTNKPAWLWLLGHWSDSNDGCPDGMNVPALYSRIKSLPGCNVLGFKNMYGHSHVNKKISDVQYLIGATGFLAEQNGPGFAYIATKPDGRQLIVNFLFDGSHYSKLEQCLATTDIEDCVHLGTVWFNATATV